jgi:hypothetical protein
MFIIHLYVQCTVQFIDIIKDENINKDLMIFCVVNGKTLTLSEGWNLSCTMNICEPNFLFLTVLCSVLLLQDTEKYVIYNVNKEEYDTCRIMSSSPRIVAYCTEPYIERWAFALVVLRHLPHYEQQSQNRCLLHGALHREVSLCFSCYADTRRIYKQQSQNRCLLHRAFNWVSERWAFALLVLQHLPRHEQLSQDRCLPHIALDWEVSLCIITRFATPAVFMSNKQSQNRCLLHRALHWEVSLCITWFATHAALWAARIGTCLLQEALYRDVKHFHYLFFCDTCRIMSSNSRIVPYCWEPYTCPSFDLALTSPAALSWSTVAESLLTAGSP